MKIENHLVNNFSLNINGVEFKEGAIIKGKILELLDKSTLIDINGHDKILAFLESNLKIAVGEELSFLIKSIDDAEIILKPLLLDKCYDENTSNNENPISKLLQSLNIKEGKLSIGLAENLMKYNAPLTEKNLIYGIKTLEKLEQLINLNDNEKVVLIQSTKNKTITNQISNIEILKNETTNNEVPKNEINYLVDENPSSIENLDIKNLLVVNKNDYAELKDFKSLIKEFFETNIKLEDEDENIRIISFLLKNNMKPSLNNIKNLNELNENPLEFIKDLKQIDRMINTLRDDNKDNPVIPNNTLNIENLKLKEDTKLNEFKKLIRDFNNIQDLKSKENLNNLDNKIQFLKELNRDLSFLFFPINYGKEEFNGLLTLIKQNRNKNVFNNKVNIYINVNTNSLGNIRVSCQSVGHSLYVKMNINKKDLELFESKEKQLIEKISSIGYSLKKIEFIVDSNIKIMDTLVSNSNPTYILDLKV